jgi:hypothetical protein
MAPDIPLDWRRDDMSLRITRASLLLGPAWAVAALFFATLPATAPAFVGVEHKTLENWVVAGSLEPKKLAEPINLPKGSTFNGTTTIEFENFFENPHGSLGGTVTVPPFEAALRLLGIVPTTVGVTFEQVGPAEGTVTSVPTADCPGSAGHDPCVDVAVPTKVNVGLTFVEPLGLKLPTHCRTSEPIDFQLNGDQTLLELDIFGPQFKGTATIPPIECEGPEALTLAPALTLIMSGPDNPYSIEISPPNGIPRPTK